MSEVIKFALWTTPFVISFVIVCFGGNKKVAIWCSPLVGIVAFGFFLRDVGWAIGLGMMMYLPQVVVALIGAEMGNWVRMRGKSKS